MATCGSPPNDALLAMMVCQCAHPRASHEYFGFCGQCDCEAFLLSTPALPTLDLSQYTQAPALTGTMGVYAYTTGTATTGSATTTYRMPDAILRMRDTTLASHLHWATLTTPSATTAPTARPEPAAPPAISDRRCTDCDAPATAWVLQRWVSEQNDPTLQTRCDLHRGPSFLVPRSGLMEQLRREQNDDRRRYKQPFLPYLPSDPT